MNNKVSVIFQDWGLIDYQDAWNRQEMLFSKNVEIKTKNRGLDESLQQPTVNYLIFCQHPHVYTMGKSGKAEHLLLSEQELGEKKASYYQINRGGDITYHGPGQLIGYPIFDLDCFFPDIHKYLRYMEEAVIQTLKHYGISAGRSEGQTGVWLDADNPFAARKICAMGVRCSRWITMHGFALNVNADLDYFKNIIPCGISDKAVTSLNKELGVECVDEEEVKQILKQNLSNIFGFEYALESVSESK